MKKILCILLAIALAAALPLSASASEEETALLSALSDEELAAFLEENNIYIP